MTAQEALDVFGSQISAQYFDGSDYVDCTFSYDSVQSVTSIDSTASYQFGVGAQFLRYYCFLSAGTVQQNPAYITFDIKPTYSILNTTQIHSFIALSSRLRVGTTYQSPSWDWSVGGSTVHLENRDLSSGAGSGYYASLYGGGVTNAVFVPFDYSSASMTSAYSYRATFSGNYGMGDNSNRYALCIGIPYIDNNATGATGTLPPEESQPDINVNVNVDLSGMESRLDDVAGGIDSINSALYDDSGLSGLSSVDDVGIPPLQFDYSTIDDVGEVLEDVPEEVAAGGFWWKLAFDVLHFDSPFWAIVPLICILALCRYLLWRG